MMITMTMTMMFPSMAMTLKGTAMVVFRRKLYSPWRAYPRLSATPQVKRLRIIVVWPQVAPLPTCEPAQVPPH